MKFPALFNAVLLCFLSSPVLWGQAAASQSKSAAPGEATNVYPDQAYLSSRRYTSVFFGFSFELPEEAHLRPVPQPAASDGSVQLAQLGGPPPADAEISIVAYLAGSRQGDAKGLLRNALDQELYTGVEELRGLSRTSFGGHPFYLFETRRGIEQHMFLATEMNGYVLRVVLAAHNERVLKQMELAFQHLQFFPPSQLPQYVQADAKTYEGPAVAAHRVEELLADPPANRLAAGEVQGSMYRNAAMGLSCRIPQGWIVEPEGAVEPALARPQRRNELLLDGSSRAVGGTEQQLMRACSRTLFSAWARRPGPDGQLPYDDFGEVTVSAIAGKCFPGLEFPADAKDQQAFKSFISELGLTHPILRDMRNGKVIRTGDSVVLVLRGAVAMQVKDEELSRRISVAMAVTQRRGDLVIVFFAAPHDSDLQTLLEQRVLFDPEPRTTEAKATKPARAEENRERLTPAAPASAVGGLGSATEPTAREATADKTPQANVASGQGTALGADQNATAASAPQTATEGDGASNDAAAAAQESSSNTPPSLLRPGENMKDQQLKGAPIPKH